MSVVCLQDVMRRNFISLAAGDSLASALQLMALARLRALPVVDDGALCGVITSRAVFRRALEGLDAEPPVGLDEITVAEVMDPQVSGFSPDVLVAEAVRALSVRGDGCLPVVDPAGRGALLGLVVESDLLRRAYGRAADSPDAQGPADTPS